MRLLQTTVGLLLGLSLLAFTGCGSLELSTAPPAEVAIAPEAAGAGEVAAAAPETVPEVVGESQGVAVEAEAPTAEPPFTPSPTLGLEVTPTPLPTETPPPTETPLPTDTPPPLTETPVPQPIIRVDGSLDTSINVRGGPGTNYPIVGQLLPGQEMPVTGRSADGTWWQLDLSPVGGTSGWIYGQLVTFQGDDGAIAVAEAPPPPPTATPAPVAEAPPAEPAPADNSDESAPPPPESDDLGCGKDFCVTYQNMLSIHENGGCIGNHSIYITVLEGPPPGRPLDGVVIGDTFGNVEVASGDKGPGTAEVTLWMNDMSLIAKRHINGTPFTSEQSFSFASHDENIPADLLYAKGYCESIEDCTRRQNSNQLCRGHYSWQVTFHKFD